MSNTIEMLQNLSAKIEAANSQFNAKAEEALNEAKKVGGLSTETKASVDKMAAELNTLREAEKSLKAELGELQQHVAQMPLQNAVHVAQTLGQQVISAELMKEVNGNISANRRLSVPVQAALTTPKLPDRVIEPHRLPDIDVKPKHRLFIRDLIAGGTTTSNAIFWVQQTGFTNKAAAVPEGTAKPYSDITFATQITPVATLAHMFKASKQVLDDFGQLKSLIDSEMRYGLKFVEEQQILFGDGANGNIKGIVPQASQYKAEIKVEKATAIDDIRLAMLQAQLALLPPSAIVTHFVDWATVELIKDSLGRYLLSNPQGYTTPTLWGLPVIATDVAAFRGKFLVGAFDSAAQIFDREQMNVVISSENEDDFGKNMISIRCEERLALAVKRPEAFIYGDFIASVAPKG
ncbi:phage major capsid protein [Xenorhabdus sp. PB30.3]|uniref:phage major capsid protein n=1 Tax=Xenorhabdus sp. PB30.3 TaxID=2788941 RepID=UPI001E44D070|nr:phage major capsid protein [Xenorhabdus sp. PB30.3]MCC8381449.1 phage major capsid protein [Xenorhabdus sp. PB30.3]